MIPYNYREHIIAFRMRQRTLVYRELTVLTASLPCYLEDINAITMQDINDIFYMTMYKNFDAIANITKAKVDFTLYI